jgi:FtsH-binding integral membrane protein
VHQTAAVSTEEARVDVPPPPTSPPPTPTAQRRRFSAGAAVLMAVAYLVVFLTAAVGGMTAALPSDTLAIKVGVGAVAGFAVSLLLVAIALFLAGLYWLAVRVSKDRATFAEALLNWPVAVLVGLVALWLSVVPW